MVDEWEWMKRQHFHSFPPIYPSRSDLRPPRAAVARAAGALNGAPASSPLALNTCKHVVDGFTARDSAEQKMTCVPDALNSGVSHVPGIDCLCGVFAVVFEAFRSRRGPPIFASYPYGFYVLRSGGFWNTIVICFSSGTGQSASCSYFCKTEECAVSIFGPSQAHW